MHYQKVHIVLPQAQNLIMELHTSKGLVALVDLNARMTVTEARSLLQKNHVALGLEEDRGPSHST